jgi:dihydroorotate dehydrogenase (NAD+) catalytic subunit
VSGVRSVAREPLFVKLSPALPDIAGTAAAAVEAGADGITVVNTMPGLLIDTETRRPRLGFGSGGMSGPALLPVGLLATARVARAVPVPIIGAGGIARVTDVVQYLLAGATLVAIGTAALKDPRLPEQLVRGLAHWCRKHEVGSVRDLIGHLEWNA